MSKTDLILEINGKRVYLRYPKPEDQEEFVSKSKISRKFHRKFVSPPDDPEKFSDFIKRNESESNECLLICRQSDGQIIGVINLSQIFFGTFKNAYLGYYLFAGFGGRGMMTEALRLALTYAFRKLKLHRLEANIQPHNSESIRLVKRCGFSKEGFSPKYLKISGKWRDHERWAIIRENWIRQTK